MQSVCAKCGKVLRWGSSLCRSCYLESAKRPLEGRSCNFCGCYFTAKDRFQCFCTDDCRDKASHRGPILRTCEECGTIFSMKPAEAATRSGRFCSSECKNSNQRAAGTPKEE